MLFPLILLSSLQEPAPARVFPMAPIGSILLEDARLWDGTGAPVRQVDILVHDGLIQAIEDDIPREAADSWVAIDSAFVTPGLIDAHVHVTLAPGAGLEEWPKEKLDAHLQHHLRAYVAAGVTTVLDCAGMWEDLDRVQEWLDEGEPGPRVLTLGEPPTIADAYGHAVLSELRVQTTPEQLAEYMVAHRAHGAHGVKLLVEDGPTKPIWPMPQPEWWQAVQTSAAEQSLPLYAHAMTPMETQVALGLEPRALLHGLIEADPEVEAAIAESGVYVVSTANLGAAPLWGWETERLDEPLLALLAHPEELAALRDEETRKRSFAAAGELTSPGISPRLLRWMSGRKFTYNIIVDMLEERLGVLTRLNESGVPLVMGSDAPGWPVLIDSIPGYSSVREMELLAQAGLSAEEVLIASTQRSAEMLGMTGQIGVVQVGAQADLIVHNGQPLHSVSAFRDLQLVMRGGVLASPEWWMTASAADLAPKAQGPALLQPVDKDGACEVTELATGRVLVSAPGACGAWTVALSPTDPTQWVITLGDEAPVMTSTAGALPALPSGDLDGLGFDEEGGILAFSMESPEVNFDEEEQRAWLMVQGKQVEVDYDTAQMFNPVVCTPNTLTEGDWLALEPEVVQLYEGMYAPYCDGVGGRELEGFLAPGRDYTMPEGAVEEDIPEELRALSKDDFTHWVLFPELSLAVSSYWFEGAHISAPIAHQTDLGWMPLEGVEADEPVTVYIQDSLILACTPTHAHLYQRFGYGRVWTAEGVCPAHWNAQ